MMPFNPTRIPRGRDRYCLHFTVKEMKVEKGWGSHSGKRFKPNISEPRVHTLRVLL